MVRIFCIPRILMSTFGRGLYSAFAGANIFDHAIQLYVIRKNVMFICVVLLACFECVFFLCMDLCN